MPIGAKMAVKSVKHKVKKEAEDVVGLDDDNDKKHRNKMGKKKSKKKGRKKGRGIL